MESRLCYSCYWKLFAEREKFLRIIKKKFLLFVFLINWDRIGYFFFKKDQLF